LTDWLKQALLCIHRGGEPLRHLNRTQTSCRPTFCFEEIKVKGSGQECPLYIGLGCFCLLHFAWLTLKPHFDLAFGIYFPAKD